VLAGPNVAASRDGREEQRPKGTEVSRGAFMAARFRSVPTRETRPGTFSQSVSVWETLRGSVSV